MQGFSFNFQNIVAGQGFELTFAGMTIVFTALVLVSTFIALLPKALVVLNRMIPEVHHHTAKPKVREQGNEAQIAAAIGFALHAQKQAR